MGLNLDRLAVRAEIFFCGHIFNPFWHSRLRRRQRRGDVKVRALDRYFRDRYLPAVLRAVQSASSESVSASGAVSGAGTPSPDDGKIYTIWLQGEQNAPDLVKACFASIRRHCPGKLVVLDEKSLGEMITLPEVIVRKYRSGKMKPAHFADICRVELLHEWGGFWMDSTCFVTAPVPEWIFRQDFFVYLTGDRVASSYSFMQNCFIRARKGSPLLEYWRRMILDFWMNENGTLDYMQHQLMFRTLVTHCPAAAECFRAMPHVSQDPTHVVWWELRDKPYSAEGFRKAASGAFFQKTSYLDVRNPKPGTTMYEMIYGNP